MAATLSSCAQKEQINEKLLIGTYTAPGKSEGIYVYDFNTDDATLKQVSVEKNVINPSYLALTEDRKFVYAVNEDGNKSMTSAFSFDADSGKLGFINRQNTNGADPCYLIADDTNVITANYTGGNITVFGRKSDGGLSPIKQHIQHTGSSVNKERQATAHVHMVKFTPDKKYVVVNDLGEDKVFFYAYHKDAADSVLVLKNSFSVKPGSGPRHIVFGNNGKFAYLIKEMTGEITVFSYNDGTLQNIQDATMVHPDFKGNIGGSHILLSADGKFLYASNRGTANTITTFAIGTDGKLTSKGNISSGGKGPRAFVIDPSGKWLLAGHQNTNDVIIFKRDITTGLLTATDKKIELGAPVCFVFVPQHNQPN